MRRWLCERACERSTWLGLIALATACGWMASPEQADAIVQAGVAIGGLLAACTRDPT